jgi:putative component of membrane protein insertase Oxa1/YidC/SpoIIIJ protein YidD
MTTVAPVLLVAKRLAQAPIHLYRYALEAIEKHGPLKGVWLTLRRLSRCHPVKWLGGSEGHDPVPESCTHHRH